MSAAGLTVIHNDYVAPPLGDIQPVNLVTTEAIESFWPRVRPLLERCVNEAMHGELLVDDIKQLALNRQITLMVFTDDVTATNPAGKVHLAVAVEPMAYPRLPGVNILAMGGSNFGLVQKKYWEYFKGWVKLNGAQMIEASVSPAMERILRRYGYVKTYSHVRCKL